MALPVYPPPKRFRQHKSGLPLAGRRWVVLEDGASNRLRQAADRFGSGLPVPASVTFGRPPDHEILVSLHTRKIAGSPEAYDMTCDQSGITIEAAGDAGLFYGLCTLAQVLAQTGGTMPCFSIRDEPDFPRRGVMLDISRCKVPKLETLFDQIDQFAGLKYNELQLYTEHTFAFVNHPIVWSDASPLTATDIIRLREYCEARFIELVPNLNSFGHFERWLRHPEYRSLAECPDGFTHPLTGHTIDHGSTLKPARSSVRFLEALYDEYLPLFAAGDFNIGGDEPWELGQGWSRKRCESRGTTSVYMDFLREIQKLVSARGRQMMFWSDIVLKDPDCLGKLSERVTALNWGYEANHPFKRECEIIAGAGLPFYVCPGTSAWNSLTGRTVNMLGNVSNAARNGVKFGARGYLLTDWGDHGHHQYLPLSYPGYLMGACHAWNHRGSRNVDPADGLDRLFFAGQPGTTGELILELGRAHELASGRIRNATLFNRALFWQMRHEPAAAKGVTNTELKACLDRLGDLRSRVPADAGREALVRDELENAIDMAVHGLHRLQLFRGVSLDHAALRAELMGIISRHESLWLARNRPGGLRESIGHLQAALDVLPH